MADGEPVKRLTKQQKQLINSYEHSNGRGSYHRNKPIIPGFEKPTPHLDKMLNKFGSDPVIEEEEVKEPVVEQEHLVVVQEPGKP